LEREKRDDVVPPPKAEFRTSGGDLGRRSDVMGGDAFETDGQETGASQ
jgi:hypothetical protein